MIMGGVDRIILQFISENQILKLMLVLKWSASISKGIKMGFYFITGVKKYFKRDYLDRVWFGRSFSCSKSKFWSKKISCSFFFSKFKNFQNSKLFKNSNFFQIKKNKKKNSFFSKFKNFQNSKIFKIQKFSKFKNVQNSKIFKIQKFSKFKNFQNSKKFSCAKSKFFKIEFWN